MHRTTPRFWGYLDRLPQSVQSVARQNFELLRENPAHPSLHLKKAGRYWAVRAGRSYRALAVEDGEDFIWFWIGGHDEYLRVIGR